MNDMALNRAGVPALASPRAPQWDSTLALLRDPYRYIGRTCASLGSDAFETRLMLQRAVCMSGAPAAALFYDPALFQRTGAAPEPLKATLFGKGALRSLDGVRHLQRKALFLGMTTPAHVASLVQHTRHAWEDALPGWSRRGPLPLYRALQPVLTQAVCAWAGVPLPASDLARRTSQLVALFDSAASGPWQHIRSRWARRRTEAWLASLVQAARDGHVEVPPGRAAHAAAWHREVDGRLLPPRIAAVELINLLRPVVAVSLYMTFVAHALHAWPAQRERLLASSASQRLGFVHEVRRHYPFFPSVMAKVREDFEWSGVRFRRGQRAVLDLYGTNHDPRVWHDPWRFRPERFDGRVPAPFDLVPQGGADAATHHRCPGEDVAVQLMLLALEMYLQTMRYDVVAGSACLHMDRLPAVPDGGLPIRVTGSRYS
ncbi:MAG: cytochrome P450 [Rhizobacter sp.]